MKSLHVLIPVCLVALSTPFLSGCAKTPAKPEYVAPSPAAGSRHALLYIYRPAKKPKANRLLPVYVDAAKLCALKNGQHTRTRLGIGAHVVSTSYMKTRPLPINVEAGKTYYVRFNIRLRPASATTVEYEYSLTAMDTETGGQESKATTYQPARAYEELIPE